MMNGWIICFFDYQIRTGRNITEISCNRNVYSVLFASSRKLELFLGGLKRYRTAKITIDNEIVDDYIYVK